MLEDICGGFENENKREAVLGVCKDDGRNAGGADLLVEKGCVEVNALFVKKKAVWNENSEKVRWVRREMSSSSLRWTNVKEEKRCRE